MSAALSDAMRDALAEIADAVAPRAASMPSASDIGLAEPGGWLDKAMALRPDLAERVLRVADRRSGDADPERFLERLGEASPRDLAAIVEFVAGAYYMAPEVQAQIGYAGQQALSLGRGEIGGEDVLAAMMARPPRWRHAADAGRASARGGERG